MYYVLVNISLVIIVSVIAIHYYIKSRTETFTSCDKSNVYCNQIINAKKIKSKDNNKIVIPNQLKTTNIVKLKNHASINNVQFTGYNDLDNTIILGDVNTDIEFNKPVIFDKQVKVSVPTKFQDVRFHNNVQFNSNVQLHNNLCFQNSDNDNCISKSELEQLVTYNSNKFADSVHDARGITFFDEAENKLTTLSENEAINKLQQWYKHKHNDA